MGFIELAGVMPESRAKEAVEYYNKGVETFHLILQWFEKPWLLGSKYGNGQPATSSLAVPMILLNICYEMRQCISVPDESDQSKLELLEICEQKEIWCILEIKKHIKVFII